MELIKKRNTMKKVFLILSVVMFSLSSCIDWGLEELPVYDEADMLDFDLEYRYTDKNDNGYERLAVITLPSSSTIDEDNNTVTVEASVPDPAGSFTQEERNKVSLKSIVGYAKISPAATIQPIDGAPQLGIPGDFSSVVKYQVTAADEKTVKTWTINITLVSP